MSRQRGPTDFFSNFERTFTGLNDKLEKNVRDHLRNVYATMGVGIVAAALGAAIHLFTNILQANFLLSLVGIGLMFALMSTPHTPENFNKRMAYFVGFCGLSGLGMGPLLAHVAQIEPALILTALMSTAIVFLCFTLAALHAPSTKFLHLGGFLSSALMCMFFAVFFAPKALLLWGGLVIACLFILYDTQMIAEKARRGDEDFVWHAVELFIDFADLFRHLLILLSRKEENDKRKRRD